MSLKSTLRAGGFRLMCIGPVNSVLRAVVRPVRRFLPWGVVHSIPKIGDIEVELPDGRTIVFVSDGYDSLATRMYWSGIDGFEPESLRLFMSLIEDAEVVVDVGAHVGLYALIASVDRPEVTTVAFEPVPRNLKYLEGNAARNNAPGLTVERCAVGDHSGEIEIRIPDTLRLPATASIADQGEAHADFVPTRVDLVALDDYVEANGIQRVDVIKLDVEGAEASVLAGARTVIERDQPAIICEILHGIADTAQVVEQFAGSAYRFFLVTDDGLIEQSRPEGDPSFFYKNYLLIPDERIPRSLRSLIAVESS